jgi:hypothetical protein
MMNSKKKWEEGSNSLWGKIFKGKQYDSDEIEEEHNNHR